MGSPHFSRLTSEAGGNRLRAERVAPENLFVANLAELPDGVLVKSAEEAYLVYNNGLLAWSAGGFTKRIERPQNTEVIVLTPKSTVATIRAGYAPEIHTSANQWGGP